MNAETLLTIVLTALGMEAIYAWSVFGPEIVEWIVRRIARN